MSNQEAKLPSLFIAHGAPVLAMEDNEYTRFLGGLLQHELRQKPKAIVLLTAHWEHSVQQISSVQGAYGTIYDFSGFPEEMYRMTYPAPGNPELAERIQRLLAEGGTESSADASRGLDHGAWVVLRLLRPQADIPVVQMSVNPELPPESQYEIGKQLASLREQGVLIVASGGTVHNLRRLDWSGPTQAWAVEFDDWLKERLERWDTESLFRYDELAPYAQDAVPPYGREHFVPIFYALGAADDSRTARLLHRSYRYGSLSHSVWSFGA